MCFRASLTSPTKRNHLGNITTQDFLHHQVFPPCVCHTDVYACFLSLSVFWIQTFSASLAVQDLIVPLSLLGKHGNKCDSLCNFHSLPNNTMLLAGSDPEEYLRCLVKHCGSCDFNIVKCILACFYMQLLLCFICGCLFAKSEELTLKASLIFWCHGMASSLWDFFVHQMQIK